jgi:hypothetical protein
MIRDEFLLARDNAKRDGSMHLYWIGLACGLRSAMERLQERPLGKRPHIPRRQQP